MSDPFVPRDYETITDNMRNWVAGDPDLDTFPTDFTAGSLERSQLEGVAVQIEELEVRTAQGILNAIPAACFKAFGFDLLPAASAQGAVVFSALTSQQNDIVIPSGTLLLSQSGMRFQTTAIAKITAGALASGNVPISCLVTGPDGNVPAYQITRLATPIYGIDVVTNPSATTGGSNQEDEAARASRFAAYVKTLQRGTLEALEFAAISTGLISSARAVEPFMMDPIPAGVPFAGLVWVFVDDGGDGSSLSSTVATAVKQAIYGYTDANGVRVPGWKAAGTVVKVLPAGKVPIRVAGMVRLSPAAGGRWQAVQDALSSVVTSYFSTLGVGDSVSYQRLSAALQSADSDVLEVDLWAWKSSDAAPSFSVAPTAADISPLDPTVPTTVGARCVLDPGASSLWSLAQ